MGQWMKVNGEAIYGTKASPWGPFAWGRCTSKETKDRTTLYFSIFEKPADGKLVIPHLNNKVVTVVLLSDGTKLKTSVSKERALTISSSLKSY